MEKNKLLNLIAGIAGAVAVVLPALGSDYYGLQYWMFGSILEEGETYNLFNEMKPDEIPLGSLTIIAACLIIASAVMFFLSMAPNMKMPVLTMLGWILGLGGCVVFMIFGCLPLADEPLFLWRGMYPIGIIVAFGSGGVGLVSWIFQIRK